MCCRWKTVVKQCCDCLFGQWMDVYRRYSVKTWMDYKHSVIFLVILFSLCFNGFIRLANAQGNKSIFYVVERLNFFSY